MSAINVVVGDTPAHGHPEYADKVAKGGDSMSGPLLLPDGTPAAPALQVGDADTGLARIGGDLHYVLNGSDLGKIQTLYSSGSTGSVASVDIPVPIGMAHIRLEMKPGSSNHSFYMQFVDTTPTVFTDGYAYILRRLRSDLTVYDEGDNGAATSIRVTTGNTARNDQRAIIDIWMDTGGVPRGYAHSFTVAETNLGVSYAMHAEYTMVGFQRDNAGSLSAIRFFSDNNVNGSWQVWHLQ